jgi:hypothetical protein
MPSTARRGPRDPADLRPSRRAPLSSRFVEPLLVILAGVVSLAGGTIVLRSFGPGYRVGRLLAITPTMAIAEAEAIAATDRSAYVRVEGRVDSAEDFPDEYERPLVFRRRRLEAQRAGRWTVIDEDRQLVAFAIRDGMAVLAIDGECLDEGLVVLPRESLGTAADAADRAPGDLPPSAPVRLRIEQISSVEHAIVLGVPRRRADGTTILTSGLGRPLILSTLERTEAMQLLAGGRRGRSLAAMALFVGGIALAALGLAWALARAVATAIAPMVALAASPDPSPIAGGDTRSGGEGPGLVGSPLGAIAAVLLIALASVVLTLVYLRLTSNRRTEPPTRS